MGGKNQKSNTSYWKGLALGAGIWCLLILAVVLIWPYRSVWAASFNANEGSALGLSTLPLDQVVRNIIRWALGFLGLIAVIFIVYAGFMWMTAAGNEERIDKAKRIIQGAIIGLVIILLSFAIVQFFFHGVTDSINGSNDNTNGGVTPPGGTGDAQFYVRLVSPHEDEDNVSLCRSVQGVFNHRMNESTGAITLTQVDSGQAVPGTISYQDGTKIKLDPGADLAPLEQYRALIPDTVEDTQGDALDQQKEWYFTTGAESDDQPPRVNLTWPEADASDICLSSPIVVEFNEPMDLFTLTKGNVSVTGPGDPQVSSVDTPNDRTMAITLSAPLEANQVYTVTLNGTPGHIADACGNPLDGNGDGTGGDNYGWSFTTGIGTDCAPKIDSISGTGYYETDVTIEGTNFTSIPNTALFSNDVTAYNNCFNTSSIPTAACVKEWTNTRIKVTLPASGGASNGAVDGPVKVRVGALESNGKNLNVQAPHVDYVSPGSGGPGQFITISGSNFGGSAGQVLFRKLGESDIPGNRPACESWWQNDEIIVKVPEGFSLNDVAQLQIETAGNRRSNLEDFRITGQVGPGLCSIAPKCGGTDIEVTLVGEALSTSGQVKFNSTSATTSQWTDSQIKAAVPDVPDQTNPYNVTVTVGGLTSNGVNFDKPCGDSGGDEPGSGEDCSGGATPPQCGGTCTDPDEYCRASDCTCRTDMEGVSCDASPEPACQLGTNCGTGFHCDASDCACHSNDAGSGANCDADTSTPSCDPGSCTESGETCRPSDCTCRPLPAYACSTDPWQCVPNPSACGGGQGCLPNCTCAVRPTLVAAQPASGATDVCRNAQLTWEFSDTMNGASADNGSIQVTVNGGAAAGAVCSVDKDCASDNCTNNACSGSTVNGSFSQPSDKHFIYGNFGLLEADTYYQVKLLGNESGVKSSAGLGLAGDAVYTFKTAAAICDINNVVIEPGSWLFVQRDASQSFEARAYHDRQPVVSLDGVYEFTWGWTADDPTIITLSPTDAATTIGSILNKDGRTRIRARATVTTEGKEKAVTGSADIEVNLCERPWPDPGAGLFAPFVDSENNFSTWYCTDDGLPMIRGVVNGSVSDDLRKEYFFNGLRLCQGTNRACTTDADCDGAACTELSDAVGVRVMSNLAHQSPRLWYETNLPGEPLPSGGERTIDGYPALRVGRTNYVAAANVSGGTYMNIYLMSYSEGASSATQQVYNELIRNWRFTINRSDEEKQLLIRDVERLGELSDIGKYLADYQTRNGIYPSLQAGSYLTRRSTSAWPSWQATLGNELGKGLPSDPLNMFVYDDNGCHVPPYDHDTCWWGDKTLYPVDGGRFTCQSGSSVYMYRSVPDESDPPDPANSKAELYAQLEYGGWTGLTPGQNPCAGLSDGSNCSCFNYRQELTP